jgi:peptidoglycan L-alanyl-D-glutamate endopeptidase CwlK
VQLTGRTNYGRCSHALGLGTRLLDEPDLANDAKIASRIIARFLKDRERSIKEALVAGDLTAARRLINGGSHGLAEFEATFSLGQRLLGSDVSTRRVA